MKTREEAIRFVLQMIRHPLAVMSRPMFNEAQEVAIAWNITALELLKAAREHSEKA